METNIYDNIFHPNHFSLLVRGYGNDATIPIFKLASFSPEYFIFTCMTIVRILSVDFLSILSFTAQGMKIVAHVSFGRIFFIVLYRDVCSDGGIVVVVVEKFGKNHEPPVIFGLDGSFCVYLCKSVESYGNLIPSNHISNSLCRCPFQRCGHFFVVEPFNICNVQAWRYSSKIYSNKSIHFLQSVQFYEFCCCYWWW